MKTGEAATTLGSATFCYLMGVPGGILDLMPCAADQDSWRSDRSHNPSQGRTLKLVGLTQGLFRAVNRQAS